MLARVQSYLLEGIDALACEVEVDADEGVDARAVVVGLPDAGVKESIERIRTALVNSGYSFPRGRVLVNLAPADVRKEGPVFDLPIAVGLLIGQGIIMGRGNRSGGADHEPLDHRRFLFGGELALDGRVRPIKGVIALAALAKAKGMQGVVVPADNANEAAVVTEIEVYGVRTLAEVVGLLTGAIDLPPHPTPDVTGLLQNAPAPIDFVEVRGQEAVKRAIVVAAAGGHNLLRLCPSYRHGTRPSRTAGHNSVLLWPSVRHGVYYRRTYPRLSVGSNRRDCGQVAGTKGPCQTVGQILWDCGQVPVMVGVD